MNRFTSFREVCIRLMWLCANATIEHSGNISVAGWPLWYNLHI